MPYEVTFTKRADAQAVAARILPALRQRFGDQLEADQEERSGSIRFDDGPVSLAVDIFCDDQQTGRYRIHLMSKTKRFAFLKRVEDVPQLEELKRIVAGEIAEWTGKLPDVAPL